MITNIDKEQMKPNGNKVVSLKLSSSENVIAEFIELDDDNGIITLKNPVKIIQGLSPEGQDVIMFQIYDPSSANNIVAFSVQHVISIQPVAFRFKQQYVTAILRHKLYDIEYVSDNNTFDFLTTHMMKLCEDLGVSPNLELLPISMQKITRH